VGVWGLRGGGFTPGGPIYLNVSSRWLLEARRRPIEELLQLKWHGPLGTRALDITREKPVRCLRDD